MRSATLGQWVWSGALAALVLGGWIGFAYVAFTFTERERELQDQLTVSEAARVAVTDEREQLANRLTATEATVAGLRGELALAKEERDRARAELLSAQHETAAPNGQSPVATDAVTEDTATTTPVAVRAPADVPVRAAATRRSCPHRSA